MDDFFLAAPRLAAAAVFLSPPWGGPAYQHCPQYDMDMPMGGLPMSTMQVGVWGVGLQAQCR